MSEQQGGSPLDVALPQRAVILHVFLEAHPLGFWQSLSTPVESKRDV